MSHLYGHVDCTEGHDPCEGNSLHIKVRCATGCPQFQDGSWMARGFCREPHPSPPSSRVNQADTTLAWLEGELGRVR